MSAISEEQIAKLQLELDNLTGHLGKRLGGAKFGVREQRNDDGTITYFMFLDSPILGRVEKEIVQDATTDTGPL